MDVRDLEIKIARSENLPVLPQIVSQVLKLADDPMASPKAMEKLIEQDPAITAKVLRVSNSAFYGMNQVPSIGRAISILGLNTIRSLVVGVAYQQIISGKQVSAKFSKLEFWRHSLSVAICARILGKLKMPLKAEELYCAGMMHEVGLLVLDRFLPEELDKAIKIATEEAIPLNAALQRQLAFDQCEVGALLAERWGLSPLIKSAVRTHLNPVDTDSFYNAVCVVRVAETIANQAGYIHNSKAGDTDHNEKALAVVDLPMEQIEVIKQVVSAEVSKAEQAFQIK